MAHGPDDTSGYPDHQPGCIVDHRSNIDDDRTPSVRHHIHPDRVADRRTQQLGLAQN